MRSALRPLAALFAAAYLLAGGLALALHSHAHLENEQAQGACTTCSCGHHHHAQTQDEHGQPGDAEHEHGEHDCVVCQFLAQPPLTAPAVTLITAEQPLTFAAEPMAPSREVAASVTWWSRGPPVG